MAIFSRHDNPDLHCKCVGKHIPKPMEMQTHYVWPLADGGPDTIENLITVCPSTHTNIHRLWKLYDQYNGRPPWHMLKNYSEYTRYVVEKGREQRRSNGQPRPLHQQSPVPYSV